MGMIKRTWYTILYIVIALFTASLGMTLYSGVDLQSALIWNVLSSLNIFYASVILPFNSETNPLVFISSILDGAVFALLTVLLASWFFSFIRSINVRGMIVLSKIKKLKKHVIVVPFSNLAQDLMDDFGEAGITPVAITDNDDTARELYKRNGLVVVGDPRDEETFYAANIAYADFVVACSEDITENALIVITAKAANKDIRVISKVKNHQEAAKISKAGAYMMVMPEATAGEDIGLKISEWLKG
jgi:hypothetical protein